MEQLEALERLQRLKESGALSEAEFAEQKARVLSVAASAPVQGASAPADVQETAGTAIAPVLVAGVLGVLVAVGAGAWYALSGMSEPDVVLSAAATNAAVATSTPEVPALASLPANEQLRLASLAALGFTGSRTRKEGTQPVITKAERLINLPFATVLLTSTRRPDGCHACSGHVGVYYLTDDGGAYKVTGKWPEAVSGWGWGNVPEWRMSNEYTLNPAIVASGADGNQGYFCGGTTITELTVKGPVTSFIATSTTNEGAVDPDSGADMTGKPLMNLDGKITGIQRGKALEVSVTGTDTFTESYVMRGGKFVIASGETKLGC